MILKMFAVYDSKAGVFAQPFFTHNSATATRGFADQVNKADTQFNNHPEDYTLFLLGEYDDQKGSTTCLTAPQSLGLASEFLIRN